MAVVRRLGHRDRGITGRCFHPQESKSHQQIEKGTFLKSLSRSEAGSQNGASPSAAPAGFATVLSDLMETRKKPSCKYL